MTDLVVESIEVLGVGLLESLHELGQRRDAGLNQQMDMVGQQTERQKIDAFLLALTGQFLQVSLSVGVVAEDRLAVIAPANNMIHSSGVLDANGSRHEETTIPSRS